MSEPAPKYITDALEMIGAQAQEPPKPGFKSPNYTQSPNDFFDLIPEMGDAELRVTLVMIRQTFGYHRNGFKMGITKLAAAAGLSPQGARDGAAAAQGRGTFYRVNPEAITEAEWALNVVDTQPDRPSTKLTPTLNPVEGTPQPSGGQVGIKERVKKEKEKHDTKSLSKSNFPLGWKLAHEEPITAEDLQTAEIIEQAPVMFEKAFGFGKLPWDSTRDWERLRKLITEVYRLDRMAFGNYVVWRKGEGKYAAMSNKQIRQNPAVFIDTGWPEFEATQVAPTAPPAPKTRIVYVDGVAQVVEMEVT